MFAASFDVSAYLKTMREVNKVMDDAAKLAYREFPDKNAAVSVAKSYLATHTPYANSISVMADDVGLVLKLDGKMKLFFANLFGIKDIPISAFSRVRGSVFDALILFDAGQYLAPPAGKTWQPSLNDPDPSQWYAADLADDFTDGDPLEFTQRCFNPAFNANKVLALSFYNYFSNFGMNRVGVAVYPGGDSEPLHLVVPVSKTKSSAWPLRAIDAVYCAAMAEGEVPDSRYAFPNDITPETRVINQSGKLEYDADYSPDVSDVLWSYPAIKSNGDFSYALRSIGSYLLGTNTMASRGGLTGRTLKTAIVVAGDLPWSSAGRYPSGAGNIRAALNELATLTQNFKMDLKVYYVLMKHKGISVSTAQAEKLADFFSSIKVDEEDARFSIKLLYLKNSENLGSVMDGIMLDRRSAVVAK